MAASILGVSMMLSAMATSLRVHVGRRCQALLARDGIL
jgi:hypothetical protein